MLALAGQMDLSSSDTLKHGCKGDSGGAKANKNIINRLHTRKSDPDTEIAKLGQEHYGPY